MIAMDFGHLRGTLVGMSDRALQEHLTLYQGYVDALNAIGREYPRVDWTRPADGQPPPPPGAAALLDRPVGTLDLKPEGRLAYILVQVGQEAQAAGITWSPDFYLGEGAFWTADRATSINLPWFLANDALWWLVNDRKARYTEEEVERAVRHELGHALNYAFALWKRNGWREAFGDFEAPYLDTYAADPASTDHVRYLHRTGDKHYAQKHPDEDWAETFAMWLDPRSHWRDQVPPGTGARRKLEYVDALAGSGLMVGEPPNRERGLRVPYEGLPYTVGQFLGEDRPSATWSGHSELLRREPYAYNAVALHEAYFGNLGVRVPLSPAVPTFQLEAVRAWGSWESYLLDLRAIAGSTNGWALTVWDPREQRLRNVLVEDHRTGPLAGCPVLLACDCWEHSYYLDYGARKDAGLAAFFRNVDWQAADSRLTLARAQVVGVLGP